MAYANLRQLLELQPRETLLLLADDGNDGDFISSPANLAWKNVKNAVTEASSIVDLYIGGRYTLPLSKPYPELIVQITSHLALCQLYDRKRELDMPEGIKDRRERYMQMLRDIRDEALSLPDSEDTVTLAAFARVSSRPKEFSDSLLARM